MLLIAQIKLNEDALESLGGVFKLEKSLKTNFKTGLSGDPRDLTERVKLYGMNKVCAFFGFIGFIEACLLCF